LEMFAAGAGIANYNLWGFRLVSLIYLIRAEMYNWGWIHHTNYNRLRWLTWERTKKRHDLKYLKCLVN
jgi:hypothetical protein